MSDRLPRPDAVGLRWVCPSCAHSWVDDGEDLGLGPFCINDNCPGYESPFGVKLRRVETDTNHKEKP